MLKKLLTPDDIANAAQVHRGTVTAWIREGRLPAVRVGRLLRVYEEDFQRFIVCSGTPVQDSRLEGGRKK
jgi:excisionase family DNA binding protein